MLKAFDFDYLQGYALARPLSGEDAIKMFDVAHPLLAGIATELPVISALIA